MDCLSESTLLAILERRLPPSEMASVDEHTDRCAACRMLVANLALQLSTPRAEDEPPASTQKAAALAASERGPLRRAGALPVGTVLADRYVLLEIVGMGGMGVVHAAYDRQLDRKIALKRLRADDSGPARLVQEAQSLARLTHPNVVVVHDVGEALGEAYMAMEYVEGVTLRQWLQKERPKPERILEVYLEAAKGLAAAHAAGLVHRDIKPENILLGDDGRVRIMDFGLARASVIALDPEEPSSELSGRATSLAGTAPYIAPERFQGQAADARSDQFALCVSLYEALYGEHPFLFSELRELPRAMLEGRLREPPRARRVDRALRAALQRGLSPDPAKRYPSIDALASALRGVGRRRRARRAAAVAIGAAVALGGAAMALIPSAPAPPCAGSERLLVGIWDPPRREATERAILDTKLPYAQSTRRVVRETLDRYAERWTAARTEACLATRVHGEQSEEVLDLRMACLDTRLSELREMTNQLVQADRRAVEKAAEATPQLGAPELCDAAHVLNERLPPPDAATDAQVKALRSRLARVDALWHLGSESTALDEAKGISREAASVRYSPLQAEAGFWLGRLMNFRTDADERQRALLQALHAAEAGGHDRAAMALWLELGRHALWATARYDEAARAADHAEAYATRLSDEEAAVQALIVRVGLLRAKGENAEGLRAAREAVTRCEATAPCASGYLHRALVQLAIMLQLNNDADGSLATFDRAMVIAEPTLGAEHPFIASLLCDRANVRNIQQRYAEAVVDLRRAAAIVEQNEMGEGFLSYVLRNLGEALHKMGANEEALSALQRERAAKERVLAPDHPELAKGCVLEGDVLAALKRGDEALTTYQRALTILAKPPADDAWKSASERARSGLQACGAPCQSQLRRLDAWTKERRP